MVLGCVVIYFLVGFLLLWPWKKLGVKEIGPRYLHKPDDVVFQKTRLFAWLLWPLAWFVYAMVWVSNTVTWTFAGVFCPHDKRKGKK